MLSNMTNAQQHDFIHLCTCFMLNPTRPTGRVSELPDYRNKLAECQFLGYKELGLIQDWQVFLFLVALDDYWYFIGELRPNTGNLILSTGYNKKEKWERK